MPRGVYVLPLHCEPLDFVLYQGAHCLINLPLQLPNELISDEELGLKQYTAFHISVPIVKLLPHFTNSYL